MENNLVFETFGFDGELIAIKIQAYSDNAFAANQSYCTPSQIEELSKALLRFPRSLNDIYEWRNERATANLPATSLVFSCKDKFGHIQIEVNMEISDGGNLDDHRCCFYVGTNVQPLNDFGRKLSHLQNNSESKFAALHSAKTT